MSDVRLADVGLVDFDPSAEPWPGREVRVGRWPLYVRRTPDVSGDAPDLETRERAFYIHGLGGAASNWTDLGAALGLRLDGHAIDLPGFGRSAPPRGGRYSIGILTDAAEAYLESIGPSHVFGNSLGGAVAVRLAARRPDLVRTLTLISPALPDLHPTPRRLPLLQLALADVPGLRRLAQQAVGRMSPEQQVETVLGMVYGDPRRVNRARIDQAVRDAAERSRCEWAAAAESRTFVALMREWLAVGSRSLLSDAARITAPTLLLWGAKDRLVRVESAPKIVATIPGARLLVFGDTGHVTQMERPVAVARAVTAMLDDVEGGLW